MIKFRNNNIILIGDSHSYDVTYTIIKNTPNIDGYDCVFIGDGGEFGKPKQNEYSLNRINEICIKRNIDLYYMRGNHSNPDVWKRNYIFSNLFLVQDYTEAEFPNGKNALLVGGGISVDRCFRKEGLDYWADEITPYKKMDKHFNFLFAHDAPDYFNHSTQSLWNSPYQKNLHEDVDLFQDALDQRNVIGQIIEDIKPEYCISGHFHNNIKDEKFGIKYRCLDINELFLFDSDTI